MAWERRGRHRYYFAARWRDGRVEKIYLGGGNVGGLAEYQELRARAARHAERQALRDLQACLRPADRLLVDLDAACRLLGAASLLAAGYRKTQSGRWRRRRERRSA